MSGYNFGKINLPGPAGTYVYISVNGVDTAGLAVGNYGDSNDDFHGFTANSGTPVIFDPPDSSNTNLGGITASGEIFGNYTSFQNQQVGFVYNNGTFTTVSAPLGQETTVFGVTNGEIFGGYVDLFGSSHGFLDNNGVFTQIDAPGAVSTTVMGVTPSGEIAGTTFDSSDQAHGFVDINGVFTTIDPAGSTGTYVVGISAGGVVAGTYYDSAQNSHGFVDANGLISTINIAGATATAVTGINSAGEVVGYSIDSAGNVHGFVDDLGSVVTVDVPGATQTDILGINDAGDIYGFYNTGGVQYGLVGTPNGSVATSPGFSAATDTGAQTVNGGHLVTITMSLNTSATVTGTPTLQLNDNEVAIYTGGSGTNVLTFAYLPLPGDNTADLQVTGLNLPSGASISGLSGTVSGDLGLAVTGNVAPATVAQEINGLYVTLYGLAATQAGISYWESVLQNFDASVTAANAATTAISVNDETYLGQQMTASSPVVNGQTYFQSLYPTTMSDMAFVQALYQNMSNFIGTVAGDNYWLSLLQQAEASNGNNVTAARESVAGQFVHDFLGNNLTVGAAALGVSQSDYTALVNGQEALLGKAAVSQYYATETQASGGAILSYTAVTSPAFTAAENVVAEVTSAASSVAVAITGINNVIAHQSLSMI